jgi:glycosyltransferase involved in cell wall biosynthesis
MGISKGKKITMTSGVCVLVPFKNAEETVKNTLRSILSAPEVAQIILVDDHSDDASVAQIAAMDDPRIQVLESEGSGISDALNTGLKHVKQPYVVRCDADDLLEPGRFADQITFLESHPDFSAVAGQYRILMDTGFEVSFRPLTDVCTELTAELQAGRERTHLGAFLIRREVLEEIGGARPFFISSQDLDLQFRIAHAGRVMLLPQVAYIYHLHGSSISHSANNARREYYKAAARAFSAQRKERGFDDLDQGTAKPFVAQEAGRMIQMQPRHRASGLMEAEAYWQIAQGQYGTAIQKAWRAVAFFPNKFRKWRTLSIVVLKSTAGWLRSNRN